MGFSSDVTSVLEGELSKRVVFPALGVDARGIFDRYTAEFNQTEGVAVTAPKSRLSMSLERVQSVFSSLKGATVRIYDPEGTGADDYYVAFRCHVPQKFEDLSVEIPLEAV